MEILCPICKEKLDLHNRSYYCSNKHCFDLAKEGYLNLNLKNSQNTGDENEMIKARKHFLEKDHYHFLRKEINELLKKLNIYSLLDLGCGEGYYTSYFDVKEKVGVDLSKPALKLAAKSDKNTTYLLKSIFDLPLKDQSFDVITTIFAPVSSEINRLLKNKGHFLLVKPGADHLFELKQAIYEKPYLNEINENQINGLKLIDEKEIKKQVIINNEDLSALFMMTPYYHKTSFKDAAKLKNISELMITFDFIINLYQKDNQLTNKL